MQLVRENGCALANASAELWAMPKVATAVVRNEYALKYAAKRLKEDSCFLTQVLRKIRTRFDSFITNLGTIQICSVLVAPMLLLRPFFVEVCERGA